MPAISTHDQYKALQMPDLAQTIQINWTYAVARANYYRFLIDIGGETSVHMNRNDLVISKRNLRYLKYENTLQDKLTPYDYIDVSSDISFIENLKL